MEIRKKAGRISPTLMGDYDDSVTYRRLDWVYYGGTSYMCMKNNTLGIKPSDSERWQKIIDDASTPNYWHMTEENGKGIISQNGTMWIINMNTMLEASDAATVTWEVKLSKSTMYSFKFGIVNGTNDDSVYVNIAQKDKPVSQFSQIGDGEKVCATEISEDGWIWMKFQHYSISNDTYAYIILEPVIILDDHRILFEESDIRQNISINDSLCTILGKIKKWLADLKPVAFSGDFNDLVNVPTMTSLNINNSIDTLASINQITQLGFWKIASIDQSYATQMGIDENVGDFYAIVCDYNGNNNDSFVYGNLLLFSPRLANKYYYINIWENKATAIKSILKSNLLNTIEQISANTSADNVAGALALKAAMTDYNAKINQINSNLSEKQLEFIPAEGIRNHSCVIKYIELPNNRIYFWFDGSIVINNQFTREDTIGYIDAPFDIINASSMIGYEDAVSNVDAQTMIILSIRSNNRVITRGKIQPDVWVGFLTGSLGEKCII